MKINKYYPFAFVYFFINSVWLPFGLLYTILLTPVFYFWLIVKGKRQIIFKFLLFITPFAIVHLVNVVDLFYFVRSLALLFTVYIFCYAFYTMINTTDILHEIFKKISNVNFLLTVIALILSFSSLRSLFWVQGHWNEDSLRLKMFTYEASYYGTLLVPIFTYYLVKAIVGRLNKNVLLALIMIVLPLILSLSLGVIASLILSTVVLIVLNFPKFLTSKKFLYSFSAITIVSILGLSSVLFFDSENPLLVRSTNFLIGNDVSGRGRTFEAFQLAYKIAEIKSLWWGVGAGQLKIIGDPIIKSFYNYPSDFGQVSIPNAIGETLAMFGFIGLFIRLFLEVYLFFHTAVLTNYYRTFLFFYMFVYQFTGSFITNIAEYVIWILAFTNTFPEFDKSQLREPQKIGD